MGNSVSVDINPVITDRTADGHDISRINAGEIDQPTPADRMVHALMGRFTGFLSPGSMALAWIDWLVHLSASPGKQQLLLEKATRKSIRLLMYLSRGVSHVESTPCIQPLLQDK
ncbi:MAG: hypothetical protein RL564_569, partial [Pseudomonadota bacterium]